MKKVTELISKNFPNVIPEKFDEWKSIILKHNKASIILPFLSTGLLILLYLINGPIIILLVAFLIYIAYAIPLKLKANRLMNEMGITAAEIKEACSK